MGMLSRRDLQDAVDCLGRIADGPFDLRSIARRGVQALPALVPSDLTTLSICNLATGRRTVVSNPDEALSATDIACFDLFFRDHPLVRFHSSHPGGGTHRITDSVSGSKFRESALYREYYRKIGIDHAIAVPLYVDHSLLVSFVLNRSRRDFSARDRDILDLIRGPIANLLYNALAAGPAPPQVHDLACASLTSTLSRREAEVLDWVAAGKSNTEIAEILAISRRTVDKHLERIFVKLGVENRTAAAMRGARPLQAAPFPASPPA